MVSSVKVHESTHECIKFGGTGDGGEVGRGGHGQHRRGDVFGLDSVLHHLIQVRRVHVLVVVPPEAVEGDEQQLVPRCRCRCLARGLAGGADHRCDDQEKLQPHLHPHSD